MKSIIRFAAFTTVLLLVYSTYQALVIAPREETMGDAQRIFYYHVPAAIAAYGMFFVNFVASVVFLWRRSARADAWAKAAAEVGVVFATTNLVLGMIWARYAWGIWWAWDMRLTTFLILWLLYISYGVLRRSAESASSSVMAAALAVILFLDVPINYMSNRWFRTNHPQPVTLDDPRMQFTLITTMVAFFAFAAMIVWFRYRMERMSQGLSAIYVQKAAGSVLTALAFPAVFLFQEPHLNLQRPRTFMYGGYTAAWVIYGGYLLLLLTKFRRLSQEIGDQMQGS